MSDWQSIETAPKPGVLGPYILVCEAGGHVDLAFWNRRADARNGCGPHGWVSATDHDDWRHSGLEPTHWMPLPAPPGHECVTAALTGEHGRPMPEGIRESGPTNG